MLLAVSLVMSLLVAWGLVTLVFFAVWIYQTTLSLHEEENLFLDEGEAHLAREQAEQFAKMDKVRPYLLGSLSASVVLGVLTFGVWIAGQIVQ